MTPTNQGSIRLFRVFGITVFLHWSWFAVAAYEFQTRYGIFASHAYSSVLWNVFEYLGLFAIVLLHEFGHSLSCRQVGGQADRIVLWPLGGVAYVAPPQRPGATLWCIAAGPLVNVALFPVFLLAWKLTADNPAVPFDVALLLFNLGSINTMLLIFNMLPVYPLDGGQILRALLWFAIGPAKSLLVATSIGFVGVAALAYWAIQEESIWIGIMAFFMFVNCRAAWRRARAMSV